VSRTVSASRSVKARIGDLGEVLVVEPHHGVTTELVDAASRNVRKCGLKRYDHRGSGGLLDESGILVGVRKQLAWFLLVVALVMVATGGCGVGVGDEPVMVPFTAVDLPSGAKPVALSEAGDTLLIGVRRDGQPAMPGLLRRGPDGVVTDIAVHAVTPYGLVATWHSIVSNDQRILAIGGERGGAHGNLRWSVWTGSATGTEGITEQRQGFSTFGGYGAGDLIDAVLTPVGGVLIGSWESAQLGFDVAVWTTDGEVWTRQNSAGTALESGQHLLGFPMAATALEQGILIAGWQLPLDADGHQQPVVWRSTSGNTGWTKSLLPDAGQTGAALAVRCWSTACGVAGRLDDKLAMWRLADDAWVRLAGVPPIAVRDRERLTAPIEIDERLVQVVSDGGQVRIARADGDGWTVRAAAGPTGTVTAVTRVGNTIYLLAGPDEPTQTLWRTDIASIR
jgi:hypothetical protein